VLDVQEVQAFLPPETHAATVNNRETSNTLVGCIMGWTAISTTCLLERQADLA